MYEAQSTCTDSLTAEGLIQIVCTLLEDELDQFTVQIPEVTNPSSTSPTDSFQLYTYDDQGQLLDYQTDSIQLQATRGSFASINLQQSSQMIGDTANDITVTVKLSNPVPLNGRVMIQFPYWNPEATNTVFRLYPYLASPSSPSCLRASSQAPITTASSIPCTFDTATQILTLSSLFSRTALQGDTFSFTVKAVKNPINTQPVTNIEVYTVDDDTVQSGQIDWAQVTMQASTPAAIVTSSVKPDVYTVQEKAQYRLEFQVPIPLSAGCIIQVKFPSQITLTSDLTSVISFGLPNAQRTLTGSIDYTTNSYIISNACPQYRDPTNTAIVTFKSIINPYYKVETDQIQIIIKDSGSRIVSQHNDNGPTVTTTEGTLSVSPLVSDSTQEVSSQTSVIFTLKPLHSLKTRAQVQIVLPSEFDVVSTSSLGNDCFFTGVSANTVQQVQACTYRITGGERILFLPNLTNTDYTASAPNAMIQFRVYNMLLPPSEADSGTFTFTTYTLVNEEYKEVDTGSGSNLFRSVRAALGGVNVQSLDPTAGIVGRYNITIQNVNPITQKGIITIKIPTEISIPTLSSATCTAFSPSFTSSSPKCNFNSTAFNITSGFTNGVFKQGTLYVIISGLQNPRSLAATSSFEVYTFDSLYKMIEYKKDSVSVQMTIAPVVKAVSVLPITSQVVGQLSQYQFTITPAIPLITGDLIQMVFPATDFVVPVVNTLKSCVGTSGMSQTLSCFSDGPNSISLRASFPVAQMYTQFSFTVSNVYNPPSTEKTGLFQVHITDSAGNMINQNDPQITSFTVQMSSGAVIKNITVINQSRKANTMTAFTMTFVAEVRIPVNATFIIKYPTELGLNNTFQGCLLSNKNPENNCLFDAVKPLVTINYATNYLVESGTVFQITLYGLINSLYAAATSSFELEVQTSTGASIMYQKSGLSVTCDCDYPCLTCTSGAPGKCLTCETDLGSPFPLFLNGQCLTKCPLGYYVSGFQCKRCDANCAECADGGTKCTKCYPGNYLSGNTCVNKCLAGTEYQNDTAQSCQSCLAPCATCSKSTTICDTCLSVGPKTLFYMNQCLATCPPQVTVTMDANCVNCSSNCATCSGLPTVCTSCKEPAPLLDTTDSVCKETCPLGTSVQVANKCLACDPTCKTCASTNQSYCLSCQFGLNFYQSQNTCLLKCPPSTLPLTEKAVPYCRDCAPGCLDCQNSTSYCTKCDTSHVFYKFTCIPTCPVGYARLSSERNVCVKEREDCKYGYEYNDYGECELVAQVCEEGYVLNAGLDRCIPVPGAYVPFIFLIAAAGWTAWELWLYKKGRIEDKYLLITQLLGGYTAIQTLTYFVMFCLSIALDYKLLQSIHLTTLFTMLLTNLSFGLYIHLRIRKTDQVFRHWTDREPRAYKYLKYLTLAYSFKTSRLLYAKYLNKGYFNASFEGKYKAIIKPLFIASVVNFLVQCGPIVLMDIYALWFIPWGYQIMVMSIDNMILAIVIFIMEIVEFTQFKRAAISDGDIIYDGPQGKGFLKKRNDLNVMAGVPDDYEDQMDGPSSKYALQNNSSLSNQELLALEGLYLTREGFKKSQLARMAEGKSLESRVQTDKMKKYLDPDEDRIKLDNLGAGGENLHVRNSAKKSNITQEAKLLEKIVRRLNEEQKFNQLQTDPSDGNDDQLMIDPETRQMLGDLKENEVLDHDTKRKLKRDQTRERYEQNLSFRAQQQKSLAYLQNERVMTEMNRAVYGDLQDNINQVIALNREGVSIGQIREAINLESARTEKFNRYTFTDEHDSPQSKIRLQLGLGDTMDKKSHISIVQEIDQLEKDKKEYAMYYRECKIALRKERKERQQIRPKRRHDSFDGDVMREPYDDEAAIMSDFQSERSTDSLPCMNIGGYECDKHKFKKAEYLARLEVFRQKLKRDWKFDNVYAHSNDVNYWLKKEQKAVTRRTQTYERDIAIGYDPFDRQGEEYTLSDEDRNAEFDPDFAYSLFHNLIDKISDLPSSSGAISDDSSKREANKKRKRRNGKFITRDNFEIDDIMGEFEIDDRGNIVFPVVPEEEIEAYKKKRGKEAILMKDNQGRMVNKHGYLIDKRGNILNEDGDVMFQFMELDSDEDIPQPYKFEKRRKHMLSHSRSFKHEMTVENAEARRHLFDIDSAIDNEDQQLEEEFNRLRQMSRPSSVDSLVGNHPPAPKDSKRKKKRNNSQDEDDEELWTLADRKQRRLAKAYGGKPLPQQRKKKKKAAKKDEDDDMLGGTADRPLTDRLYPSLMQREEDRVKKIAMVAYRQGLGPEDQTEAADGRGFQVFFRRQMEELQMNRELAKEEFNRNHQLFGQMTEPANNNDLEQEYQEPVNIEGAKIVRISGASMIQTSVNRRDSGSSITRKQGDGVGSVLISNDPTHQHVTSIPDFIDDEELRQVEQQVADDDAQTLNGAPFARQTVDQPMRSSLESNIPAPLNAIKNSSSSALTTYNNLNFSNSQPKTTTSNVHVTNPNVQMGTNVSYIQRPTSGATNLSGGTAGQRMNMFYGNNNNNSGGSIQAVANPFAQQYQNANLSGMMSLSNNQFYQHELPDDSAIDFTSNNNNLYFEQKIAPQTKPPAFKKFDFYLPSKKKGGKKSTNLSDAGMQLAGGGQSRIKEMEKLYLSKNTTSNNTMAMQKSAQMFNQYVNHNNQGAELSRQPQAPLGYANHIVQTAIQAQQVASMGKKTPGSMRGVGFNTTITDQQLPLSALSNHRSLENYNVNGRPLSSAVNMGRSQLGRVGAQNLYTVNSEGGGDVYDGIAKVLNKIDRLKGSSDESAGFINRNQLHSDVNNYALEATGIENTTFDGGNNRVDSMHTTNPFLQNKQQEGISTTQNNTNSWM